MSHAKHVLLVEADHDYSELFRLAYETAKVSNPLDVVSTRGEAMDYLKEEGVENSLALIISAASLHIVRDFPLLRWIRDRPQFSKVPVFVLSGLEIPGENAKAHELGSNCYSEKPLSFSGLKKLIGHLRDRWLVSQAS